MRSFLYLHTSDMPAARHFYSGLLGLDEIAASEDVVGYLVGTLQLTIARHEDAPMGERWSRQLGWSGGTAAAPSFGVEVADEDFPDVVQRLRSASAPCWNEDPAWVGYWSFPVSDPMGNTVEISAVDADAWTAAT